MFDDDDRNLDSFIKDRLYFSTPGLSFNDPFDNLIYADPRKILFGISKEIQLNMDEYIALLKNENYKMAAYADLMYRGFHKNRLIREFLEECEIRIEEFKYNLMINTKIIFFLNYMILC